MLSDHHLDMIHRALDGELSVEEEAAWASLLAENDAVRQEHEALQQTMSLLDDAPTVNPPADLHARIMAAVAEKESAPITSGVVSSNPVAPPRDSGFGAWGYGLAAALVLGIAVFVANNQFSDEGAMSETDLVGTLAPEKHKAPVSSALEQLVSMELTAAAAGDGESILISIKTDEAFTLYVEGLPGELVMESTPSDKLLFDRLDSMLVISGWGGEDVQFRYTGSEELPSNLKAKFHTSTKQLSGTVNLRTD